MSEKEEKEDKNEPDEVCLAIVGSRRFLDYTKFEEIMKSNGWVDQLPDKIVSGGASGVDSMARRWAKERSIVFIEFKANWKKNGRRAGPIRNTEIVKACTHMLAIPDGRSVGTWDSINKAKSEEKEVVVWKLK